MSELRRLGGRYPCCGVRCRHDLEVGVERTVNCPRCGKQWVARLVECGPHATQMAGRPVGRIELREAAA